MAARVIQFPEPSCERVQPRPEGIEFEQHFSCKEIAEMWGFSPAKIRRMFQKEQDVMKVGEPSRRLGRKLRRTYITLSIPESVVRRVHKKMCGPKAA